MNVAKLLAGRTLNVALAVVSLTGCLGAQSLQAQTQAPYLLPYTIQTLAGGNAATTAGATCAGGTGTAGDQYGDGCLVTSPSVSIGLAGNDVHDVVVDDQGNVYFLDNGANGVVRRIDARTGLVTVYAGSYIVQTPCATATSKFGDQCAANDGKANAAGGYTGNFGKARGLGIAHNGDLYIADYGQHLIQKISAATGVLSFVAGSPAAAAKATSNGGVRGYSGDGGAAYTAPGGNYPSGQGAALNSPRGVALDAAGNIYIADSSNNTVRKINATTGVITTIGGAYPGANTNATAGFAGDGGPAAAAATLFNTPEDVEIDGNGNIFIADQGNARVRVIYTAGTLVAGLISNTNAGTVAVAGNIYTVVGGSTTVYTPGTQVLATSVLIGGTRKIALDSRGNLYVADNGNDIIWFVDATTGYMRPIAGTFGQTSAAAGCAQQTDTVGDNCVATAATLNPNNAMGASLDAQGQLYITDPADNRLRKVLTNQVFAATAVGAASTQILDVHFAMGDGPAALNPYTITGSAGYTVAKSACTVNTDLTQDCLLTISFQPVATGLRNAYLTVASTLSGNSIFGLTGVGVGASLALDPGATAALGSGFKTPTGITQDQAGNTYIADTGSNRVLRISANGTTTVIAGTGTAGFSGDGAAATAATLNAPQAVTITRRGLIYIADTGNNAIRRVDSATGIITTVAGRGTATCSMASDPLGNGCPATLATLNKPAGLVADPSGNVYVSDTGNNEIRELTSSGYLFYVAGLGVPCASTGSNGVDALGNGCLPSQTTFNGPTGLALDTNGNLYVADTGNSEVRELALLNNVVVRVAGSGQAGSLGNGGTANQARLNAPTGVSVDAGGNVYIADTGNHAIRIVSSGNIDTIAGTLTSAGTGVLPGSAAAILLSSPGGVYSNGAGQLTVLDSGNNRVFTDDRGSVNYDFGRTNLGSSSPTLLIQQTSTGSVAATLATPLTTNTGASTAFTLVPTGSAGCTAGQKLAPGSGCQLIAQFTPQTLGMVTARYTETGTTASNVPFVNLSGTGATLTTTTAVSTLNSKPQFSIAFTVTTAITPSTCNTAAPSCSPTGTVQYFVDGKAYGGLVTVTPTATGAAATQSFNSIPVGTHSITAVYSGDPFYASSSAAALSAVIAQGPSTVTVTASNNPSLQFTDLSLAATVKSPTTDIPTGSVTFFAGTQQIGIIPLANGVAVDADKLTYDKTGTIVVHTPQSFNLPAGTYSVTAVYSGDSNYVSSTSTAFNLVIAPDAPTFLITPASASVGTAQGSTAQLNLTVTPTNTLAGTVTFACTGLPQFATCTFQPTSLIFTAVAGVPAAQSVQATIFTDVPSAAVPTAGMTLPLLGNSHNQTMLATLLGWPVLLLSLGAVFGFRKRLQATRLLSMLALLGILGGASAVLSGCSGNNFAPSVTPVGVYAVKLIVSGPGGVTTTTPIQLTVGKGVAGQL